MEGWDKGVRGKRLSLQLSQHLVWEAEGLSQFADLPQRAEVLI